MKVKIGKYTDYFGPYHLAETICFWAPKKKDEFDREEFPVWVEKFGDWISSTKITDFLLWIDSKKQRTIKIKIDKYDLWALDHTLALIILPALMDFRNSKRYGVPVDTDLAFIPIRNEDEDAQMATWNEMLDKMIWSFQQIINEENIEDDFWIQKPNFEGCDTGADYIDRLNKGTGGKYDFEARKKHDERIQEGLDLFGKHFRNLWD